ncbi:hypothetical protein JCM10213_000746 [Rhodosporidiobolus nylandii]
MVLWLHPPPAWPDTLDEAVRMGGDWGIKASFIERFWGDLPEDKKREMIRAYVAHCWNAYAVPQHSNLLLYKAVVMILLIGITRRHISHRLISRFPSPFRRIHTLAVKHISLAPVFGRSSLSAVSPLPYKSRWAGWTTVQIPLRVDGLLVFCYVLANLLVVFTGFEPVFPSAFYPADRTPLRQIVRYLADRSGILALGSTPLVVLLAARNSPLSYAGLNFGTMQLYHRWVARTTFVNVFLHAAAYSWLILEREHWNFARLFSKVYMLWGWGAFAGGLALCFAAWRRLRQVAYEVFLVGHILAALVWLASSYFHVLYLKGGDPYHLRLCYLAVSAWAFDRLLRLLSLLWNNTPLSRLFFLPSPPSRTRFLAAQGALLGASSDFIRLRITPATPWSRRRGGPGAYVFISSWTTLEHKGWESHPFSLAWPLGVPNPDEDEDGVGVAGAGAASPPLVVTPGAESPTQLVDLSFAAADSFPSPSDLPNLPSTSPSHPFDASSSSSFELLIKRYSGFTHALSSSLSLPLSSLPTSLSDPEVPLSPQHLTQLRIAVEGPYGASPSHAVAQFRQALVVAGGSGIAMVSSQLADLARQMVRRACSPPQNEVKTRRVAVVWSVRKAETVHLLAPYLTRLYRLFRSSPFFSLYHLAASPTTVDPFIDLHVYLTSPSSAPSSAARILSSLSLSPAFLHSTVHSGRPHLASHIDAFASSDAEEELLVVSCGPASLCDAAREAVRSRLAGVPSLPRVGRVKKEEESSGEHAELLGGTRRGGRKKRWEACRLVYHEEAVVW